MREPGTGPTLPGEPCRVSPSACWSDLEKWVWQEIGSGRLADINAKLHKVADPRKPKEWDPERRLSPAFLETILLHDPWRRSIPRQGVRVLGALFEAPIDLTRAELPCQLWLDFCRCAADVSFQGMRSPGRISLMGSAFSSMLDLSLTEIGSVLRLKNARIDGTLDLDSITIAASVLGDSVEAAEVHVCGAKVGGQLSLIGIKVAGTLDMDSATVGRLLLMREGAFAGVDLRGASIGDDIELDRAKIGGTLNADSTSIGGSLFMRGPDAEFAKVILLRTKIAGSLRLDRAKVTRTLILDSANIAGSVQLGAGAELNAEVTLRGTRVGGQLSLAAAKVAGKLTMDASDIGGLLLMRGQSTEFAGVTLRGMKIADSLEMSGAKVEGPLIIESANIGGHCFMQDVQLAKEARLVFANIGRSLYLRRARFVHLDLTGTRVQGELSLASSGWLPTWASGAELKLRNARADVIQDEPGAWPPKIDLDGFIWNRFGGFGADAGAAVAHRGSKWFIEWLARDEPYTPQPYDQCAKVLREMGHPEMADDVLYAGRERDRREAWRNGNNPRGTGLTLLKWFIGYGYGARMIWRPLAWVVGLVALGTAVLNVTGLPDAFAGSQAAAVVYSLDMLLPIVELEKAHANIVLDGLAPYYFYFHKIMGYVLASFLIAGLAGLTK